MSEIAGGIEAAYADDGGIAGIPWAAVFDPAANVQALTAIQERGFRAASQVIARFLHGTGAAGLTLGARRSETAENGESDFHSLVAMSRRMMTRLAPATNHRDESAELDMAAGIASGTVVLTADVDAPAVAEIWLHNGSAADVHPVHLRTTDLYGHNGAVVSSKNIVISPNPVLVVARSSRGVGVEVAPVTTPDCYRGLVLAEGRPAMWLPLELRVGDGDGRGT